MVGIQRVVGNEYILYYWWSSLGNYNLMKSLFMPLEWHKRRVSSCPERIRGKDPRWHWRTGHATHHEGSLGGRRLAQPVHLEAAMSWMSLGGGGGT